MFKWFRKDTDVKSIEKNLELIASKITKHEASLSKLRANGRRLKGAVTLYGVLFYAIYATVWALFLAKHTENKRKWLLETLPVVGWPIGLYVIRNGISTYYEKRISSEESTLASLQLQQKEKIEEFKTKTGFYTTKSLIDRYSAPDTSSSPRAANNSASSSPIANKKQSPVSLQQEQRLQQQQMRSSPRLQTQSQITPQRNIPQSLLGTVPTPASLSGTPAKRQAQGPPFTAEFAPNADALPPQESQRDRHWYDRMLDVIVGEDEGSDHSRYKLEQKIREREERIAGLELELLKLRKSVDLPPSDEPEQQPEFEVKDVRVDDTSEGSTSVIGKPEQMKMRKSKRRVERKYSSGDTE